MFLEVNIDNILNLILEYLIYFHYLYTLWGYNINTFYYDNYMELNYMIIILGIRFIGTRIK